METSLHRELKQRYAGVAALCEVRVDGYRIDAVEGDELIEIQHGSLAAIRNKARRLLPAHRLRVVKPIIARKQIVKRRRPGGTVLSRRFSPKRGQLLDIFDELIYFRDLFPHPRLTLEVLLVEVEEWRYPGHGRRRWRRPQDHLVEDQHLLAVVQTHRLRTTADLLGLARCPLPDAFHTGDLAAGLAVSRPLAQRIAYCLRHAGAIECVGRKRHGWLYRIAGGPARAVRAA